MIDRKKIKLEDEHNGSMENQQNEIFTPQIVENMSCVPDETGSWNTVSFKIILSFIIIEIEISCSIVLALV